MSDSLQLHITWDAVKAHTNQAKHGVAFADTATVLLDPLALTVYDPEHSRDEERWFTLGSSSQGKLLAVSHTYQHSGPIHVQVRIISARPATPHQRRQYENEPR